MCLHYKNVSFLKEDSFVQAYWAGMDSGHKIGRPKGSREDIHIEWRVHVALWAAWHATMLAGNGDFVECGVNTGMLSLAICHHIDFNSSGKTFYLFDTFCGIPTDQMSENEKAAIASYGDRFYEECFEVATKNFAKYPKARLIRGKVPHTFSQVSIDAVCYLSLDMNIAYPERAAMEEFWDKLVPGGIVLLDDYGWIGHGEQYETINDFAKNKGVKVVTLPTGQGLLIKP